MRYLFYTLTLPVLLLGFTIGVFRYVFDIGQSLGTDVAYSLGNK